jgi:hypothetical protein
MRRARELMTVGSLLGLVWLAGALEANRSQGEASPVAREAPSYADRSPTGAEPTGEMSCSAWNATTPGGSKEQMHRLIAVMFMLGGQDLLRWRSRVMTRRRSSFANTLLLTRCAPHIPDGARLTWPPCYTPPEPFARSGWVTSLIQPGSGSLWNLSKILTGLARGSFHSME